MSSSNQSLEMLKLLLEVGVIDGLLPMTALRRIDTSLWVWRKYDFF